MQEVLATGLVVLAFAFLIRKFWRAHKATTGDDSCSRCISVQDSIKEERSSIIF